jgi:hypothetical protein
MKTTKVVLSLLATLTLALAPLADSGIDPGLKAEDPAAESANTAALTAALKQSGDTGRPVLLPAGTFHCRIADPAARCNLRGAGKGATRLVTTSPADGPVWDSPWFQSYSDHLGPMRAADTTLTLTDTPPTRYSIGDYVYLCRGVAVWGGPNTGRADRWRFRVQKVSGDGRVLTLDRQLGAAAGANPECKRFAGVEVRGYWSAPGSVRAGEANLIWPKGAVPPKAGDAVYLTDGVGCEREFLGEFARVLRTEPYQGGVLCHLDRKWRRAYAPGLTCAVAGPHRERMKFTGLTVVGGPTPETVPFYLKFCLDVRFTDCSFPAAARGALGPAPVASTGVSFFNCDWQGPVRLNSATGCTFDLCTGGDLGGEEFCTGVEARGCRLGSFGCGTAGPASACVARSCDLSGYLYPGDDWLIEDCRTRGTDAVWWHSDRFTLRRSRVASPVVCEGAGCLIESCCLNALGGGVSPYTGKPTSGIMSGVVLADGSPAPVPPGWVRR